MARRPPNWHNNRNRFYRQSSCPAQIPSNQTNFASNKLWHRPCNGFSSAMKNIENRNILVASDNGDLSGVLNLVLTGEGATVAMTPSAQEAIRILARQPRHMDLFIIDLPMPLLTGMTLVYSIPRIFPGLPIIAPAAVSASAWKEECFHQGVAAFLERPFDSFQLLATVAKSLASTKNRFAGKAAKRNEEPAESSGWRGQCYPAFRQWLRARGQYGSPGTTNLALIQKFPRPA